MSPSFPWTVRTIIKNNKTMREIKFRAKRQDREEWVYGDLMHVQKICKAEEAERTGRRSMPVVRVGNYDVDERTIGQYTGVRDANGNTIFEGDVLGTGFGENNYTHQVVFSDGAFCLRAGRHIKMPLAHLRLDDFIIVGNIHDKNNKTGKHGND